MNDHNFLPLSARDFDLLSDRFGHFWDGVIREFRIEWGGADHPTPSIAEIAVLAMETGTNNRWKRITFKAVEVRDCYWAEQWQGTIETWNLVLRYFDGWFYLAVGIEWEDFESAARFTGNSTRMFVRAKQLLHSINDY